MEGARAFLMTHEGSSIVQTPPSTIVLEATHQGLTGGGVYIGIQSLVTLVPFICWKVIFFLK